MRVAGPAAGPLLVAGVAAPGRRDKVVRRIARVGETPGDNAGRQPLPPEMAVLVGTVGQRGRALEARSARVRQQMVEPVTRCGCTPIFFSVILPADPRKDGATT